MSASQIPSLHTLRRGNRRSREAAREGPSPGPGGNRHGCHSSRRDRVVQGTDNDASISRMSAVNTGYINDPFAKALAPPASSETRRLPIINRGTYVRTMAIDRLVDRFLGRDSGKKQIVSLGAGSDTRAFRILSSSSVASQQMRVVYHEIDFPVNTAAKIKTIQATASLQVVLGTRDLIVSESGDALHSPMYHLHPIDLRYLAEEESDNNRGTDGLLGSVDATLPTLLISECCLVYLSPTEAARVVDYFTKRLFPPSNPRSAMTPLGLILYEPIRPDDAFGRTMVSNLASRGIHLQTLNQYVSLESQQERLKEHGFSDGQGTADVNFIWERWVSEEEKERVGRLEMLDEVEEWQLLAWHYCVAWGWRGRVSGWEELERQV